MIEGSHAEMHCGELLFMPRTHACLWPPTSGQFTPKHTSVMQNWLTQILPSAHGNSPGMHGAAHWQLEHCVPAGQSAPSSTTVSQSSSVQLQLSCPIGVPTQTTVPLMH